ncbi:4-hydroxy-tetrahydrodipicolinate synthase [Lutimonas zeaxanthinifaciens]|uniref:4-hydroxy-tetrahydrodipicolinate synthase n=1 Tax=Lutimonas zeaxanthinifaciens TaxID=3060215 RepID=UPI00265CF8DC|nr:4-hydroxy-tetrahydrodipicolinate synthase [Lutimonas sp. YSD2104]WKK64876.1 4-hydroxy-tetrahydrodipicolinate synthase [Lutimonas sp. YSD2104]
MKHFKGTGVALVTPFNNDGQIDLEALVKLVRYQIDNGVDYLVVLGTTGETATLSDEEKRLVKKCVLETCNGCIPVVLGLGGNNTQRILKELEEEDFEGFSAILSVSPYYNKPSQEGIYQHYKMISAKSPLPIILYNVPPRTGSNIEVETVARLATDCKNIIGIKEAAGDFEQVLELIRKTPDDFLVISGEDKLALPLVLAGGDGVISVIGQGLPETFSKMIRMGLEGKSREAYELFYSLTESIDLIFAEGNPSGIKSMLHSLKISEPFVRLPLVPASADLRQKINTFVTHF